MGKQSTHPSYQDILGKRCVGVLDLDESKLDASVGEFIDQVGELALAGGLNLQDALLAAIVLEGADERGSDGEDGPLGKGGRGSLGVLWRGRIDDVFVAPLDTWAVARCVERSHGEVGVKRRARGGGEGELRGCCGAMGVGDGRSVFPRACYGVW